MRIVFNIDVGLEVPSYVQAGEILDKITRNLEETIGSKGSYDIQSFRANHRDIHNFEVHNYAGQAMTEAPTKNYEPEPG